MDWTDCSSKIGRYRVPPSSDFQTPPLAAPTNNVIFPEGSFVPAIAEIRPLIAAEPMLRAPRPEMVAELNEASCPCELVAAAKQSVPINSNVALILTFSHGEKGPPLPFWGEGWGGGICRSKLSRENFCKCMIEENYLEADVGKWKIASSTGTLASAFSITVFCLSGSPLRPSSIENGMNTPPIFS